jgi:hypothetical protein
VAKNKTPFIQMPRLYNVFNMPEVKAVRAVTSVRSNVDLKEALKRSSNARKVRTANKDILKFEIERGSYLLLFPSGYVEIHAPNEQGIREVLVAFRNELYECGLLK